MSPNTIPIATKTVAAVTLFFVDSSIIPFVGARPFNVLGLKVSILYKYYCFNELRYSVVTGYP